MILEDIFDPSQLIRLITTGDRTTTGLIRALRLNYHPNPEISLVEQIVKTNILLQSFGLRILFRKMTKEDPGTWFLGVEAGAPKELTKAQKDALVVTAILCLEGDSATCSRKEVIKTLQKLDRRADQVEKDLQKLMALGYLSARREVIRLTPKFFTEVDVPLLVDILIER